MTTHQSEEFDEPDCFACAETMALASKDPIERGLLVYGHMFLCPTCGNKRCPKATNHRLDCSGSNEPGQAGSRYGASVTGSPVEGTR